MGNRVIVCVVMALCAFDALAQCSFNGFFHSALSLDGGQTTTAACVQGGEFVSVPVVSGETYQLSTCNSSSGGDSQLTLYNSDNTSAPIGYNDDDCGAFSTVAYVATFTGTLYTQVNEHNCTTSTTCYTLDATCMSCGGAANTCNYRLNLFDALSDGWNGASMAVEVNGTPTNNYTLTNGFNGTFSFSTNPGDVMVLSFNSGNFDDEISYDLYQLPELTTPLFSADYSAGPVLTGPVFETTCNIEVPIFKHGFE